MGRLLPPGTLLQHAYVRRRLRHRRPGRFVEAGAGEGDLSRLLLGLGWDGVAYEPGAAAAAQARTLNAAAVADGRFEVRQADWLTLPDPPEADLFVSAMVIEHLPEDDVRGFLAQAGRSLGSTGTGVVIVPASPAHWGVEDDVAGHLRRYTRASLAQTLRDSGFTPTHLAGLTFPLSNLLLPLSNRQVGTWERDREELDQYERTIASGSRRVPWKTTFPPVASLLLNRATLYPFELLQLATRRNEHALVLYAEWQRQ